MDFEVTMRSGTSSRIAAESDLVSLLDGFSGRNKDFAQMCITGLFAVGMTVPDRARARKSAPSQTEQLLDAYRALPARERKTVHDFVTFLSEKQQSKNQD